MLMVHHVSMVTGSEVFWNKREICASAASLGIPLICDIKEIHRLHTLPCPGPEWVMRPEPLVWWTSAVFCLEKKTQWSAFHAHGSLHIINELWCFPLVTLPMHNHAEWLPSFPLAQCTWQTRLLSSPMLQDYTIHVFRCLFRSVLIKAQWGLKTQPSC